VSISASRRSSQGKCCHPGSGETKEQQMSVQQDSPAVAIAREHVDAWSNHDFDAARRGLAPDVEVTATSTNPDLPQTSLSGVEDYMKGLYEFAQGVVPGSANVLATLGDERNALVLLTVQTSFGPGAPEMTLSGARLYLTDEDGKIKHEQVVFFVAPE
jgi:hypothetical protein